MSNASKTKSDTPKDSAIEIAAVTAVAANGANGKHAASAPAEPAEPTAAPVAEVVTAAASAPTEAAAPAAPAPTEDATPVEVAPQGLRLRMKVWTDRRTGKRYLMPSAVISDPRTGMMSAYAMSDEDTKVVKLSPPEWNSLPFFYFQEDGPAPRASARPPDAIR